MITDASELTPFTAFAGIGVTTTDTFNQWRKKDNGLVQHFNNLAANSAATGIEVDNVTATISIKAGGVVTGNYANFSVTGEKIANLTITSGKLATDSVTEAKIVAGAVSAEKLANDAVSTRTIGGGQVTELKLANDAVSERTIGGGQVTEPKLDNDAVSTRTIVQLAVTNDKIGSFAITEGKIGTNAVSTRTIGGGQVTNDKIAEATINNSKLVNNTITGAKIALATIANANIANGAITGTKMSGAQTGVAPVYAARAFGSFNGQVVTAVENEWLNTIYGAKNILKIVRVSTGHFDVYFTVEMENENYAVMATENHRFNVDFGSSVTVSNRTINSFRLQTGSSRAGTGFNPNIVSFCVFQ